jgi:hypothetical protein
MQIIRDFVKSHYEWDDCRTFEKRRKKCIKLLKTICEFVKMWILIEYNFYQHRFNDHFIKRQEFLAKTLHDRYHSFNFNRNLLKFLQREIDSKRLYSKHVWFFIHFDHNFRLLVLWKCNQRIFHRNFDANKVRNRNHAW